MDSLGEMISASSAPTDLVAVGYVSGAYGLGGWIRIKPYSSSGGALLTAKTWWLDKPEPHDVDMLQAKMHSGDVVAQLMGITTRELAESLRGAAVHISRARFPALANDEFYWVDLIGLDVHNLRGELLGRVVDMMDNGAHPILRIAVFGDDAAEEMLIPFVEQFIKTVDQLEKKITVDWERDY